MTTKTRKWNCNAKGNKYQAQIYDDETGKTVAITYTDDDSDAYLLAAAPDMLEALYRVRNFFLCSGAKLGNSHAATIVDDAIAKARALPA